uniref:Putative transcription factor n=1 Tax=Corethrella appendiculata TaxID=1370023 RepID=U5EU42_9DIPT
MADDEQFSLCWNNFNTNLSAGFHESLCRGDLVDVTLAAEGQLVKAHRLVLSVCSPYFRKMFTQMPANQHAFVFLKDVSHSALKDLIQFMYCGEVNVKQDALPAFISTAEALQIKGLTETGDSTPAPQQSPAKEATTITPTLTSPRPRQQHRITRTQHQSTSSYKLESEESSDEKILAAPHPVQIQHAPKRVAQRSITPQTSPAVKRIKVQTADPLEASEPTQTTATVQTVHIVKQHSTPQPIIQQHVVQQQQPQTITGDDEYVELPVESINPKSEPEYVEDTTEIEQTTEHEEAEIEQDTEQEHETEQLQEQEETYVEDDTYGDMTKYDSSYFVISP